MKVTVDDDRCRGHGVCGTICPEVFTLTDDGYTVVQTPRSRPSSRRLFALPPAAVPSARSR